MMWKLAVLLLVMIPCTVHAQPADESEEEAELCNYGPVLKYWIPSHDEARAIEAVPVPTSVEGFMQGGPCSYLHHSFPRLTDWHLGFGSERSTTVALAYIERQLLLDLPEPADYPRALQQARRALEREKTQGPRKGARKSAKNWRRTAGGVANYLDAAGEYLRAAEELRSLPLLDRAIVNLGAVEQGASILQSVGEERDMDGEVRAEDYRLRIAVLRASITRSVADVTRATEALDAANRPFYRELAEHAYGAGDQLCDVGDSYEKLAEQCDALDRIEARLTSYWLNRAALDAVQLTPADVHNYRRNMDESADLASRLLDRNSESNDCFTCWKHEAAGRDALFRLLVIRTQAGARQVHELATKNPNDGYGPWVGTLEELERAERLASPSDTPSRFRRLAESWLALWRLRMDDRVSNDIDRPVRERYAAYLEETLARLPTIATAQGVTRAERLPQP